MLCLETEQDQVAYVATVVGRLLQQGYHRGDTDHFDRRDVLVHWARPVPPAADGDAATIHIEGPSPERTGWRVTVTEYLVANDWRPTEWEHP